MMRKMVYRGILVVLVAVFLFSGYKVASYYISAYTEGKVYDDLNQLVQNADKDKRPNDPSGSSGGSGSNEPLPPVYAESGRLYRYDALFEQNNDMVGWIQIPGTDQGYPLMQTPGDEEYYLRRNFKKKNAKTGTPFLDKDSDFENPNSRVMIHGHNLKSGGMFYPLMQYTKKSHWKKYPTLSVDTLYQQRTYQIVAVVRVDLAEAGHFAYYAYDNFTSEASYNGFMEDAKKASLYDTGITPVYGQQVLVISTCSYHVSGDGGRLAIIAVQTP